MTLTNNIAKKGLYVGAGVGLAIFAIVGLLPGSFLGGAFGVGLAGKIFGLPLTGDILSRIIVGVSMVTGIMVSALIFTVGASIIGYAIGHFIEILKASKSAHKVIN